MSNLILRTWHQHFLAVSLEDKDYISCYCHRLPDLPKMKLSKNEEFVRYAFFFFFSRMRFPAEVGIFVSLC